MAIEVKETAYENHEAVPTPTGGNQFVYKLTSSVLMRYIKSSDGKYRKYFGIEGSALSK